MLTKIPIDVVFNLASYGVRQDDRDPQQMVEGNVGLLVHLLNAIADRPIIRFIHAGSCSEYGVNLSNGELISETHPLRPTSLYGAAKAASFLIGNVLASHLSIPFVTLRLFGVFGTREAPDRLIPYLIRRLTRNQPVDLTPGEQVRDFLFEDDAVEAFVCAATASRLNSGEVYNVCTGHPTRIHEIGEEVALELGRSTDLLHWGARRYRADEPMWLVGDHRRFAKLTAWRPATSLPAGIRRMISSTPDDQDAI
jgi:nucleoside-diphosphate-sugar epimerase